MSCDFGSALAGSGLMVELASAAVMIFGSAAFPLLQSALTSYAQSMMNFAACFIAMM